ncbi:BCCT family transporter [Egicoccus halophilus]|uniref:Choline transporter n=1 Tax=Egicoccus halophilus TaxID=1670830 RepID=A0A8J3A4Z3_9ACTN|nr:BCCT family transporter [Egicoccus halophilus]GGI02760.1 choline transporter [Egicoccus halophilus]
MTSATDEKRSIRETIHPPVFVASAVLILAFVVFAVVAPETAGDTLGAVQGWITDTFGWLFILAVVLFLGFCAWMALGRYAKVRLGPDDSTPDYSTLSWFAMLFAAGMGIGLMYWGVAEPVMFYASDPPRFEPGTTEAARDAMLHAFHHWGFSPWAIYAVIGLGLAYFGFRHDQPLAIRSLFRPLLGDRVEGALGNLIDVTAVVGTMFGVATSLGLGVAQVNAGLNRVFDIEMSVGVQLVLIAIITAVATVSVLSGLDKGIQRLSQFNIVLAALLMGFVLLAGPTLFLVGAFVQNTGAYLGGMAELLSRMGVYAGQEGQDWLGGWTIFYWAWWVSWSPFVGMFIARISRGRTIREFILGVLLVPSVVSFAWFTVFGNAGIFFEEQGAGIDELAAEDSSLALFGLLEQLPLSGIVSVLAVLLVVTFFVTSSDSGSFVIDILTSGGDPDPHPVTRVFWAVTEGLVAAGLLLAGGLGALQAGAVSTGLPFTIVLVLATWSIARGLKQEFAVAPAGQRTGLPPVHMRDATDRERTFRRREQELSQLRDEVTVRERELDVLAREIDLQPEDVDVRDERSGQPRE